jgi:hypothetical protein
LKPAASAFLSMVSTTPPMRWRWASSCSPTRCGPGSRAVCSAPQTSSVPEGERGAEKRRFRQLRLYPSYAHPLRGRARPGPLTTSRGRCRVESGSGVGRRPTQNRGDRRLHDRSGADTLPLIPTRDVREPCERDAGRPYRRR